MLHRQRQTYRKIETQSHGSKTDEVMTAGPPKRNMRIPSLFIFRPMGRSQRHYGRKNILRKGQVLEMEQENMNELVGNSIRSYKSGDKNALNDVYDHLVHFCLRVISKTRGKYINANDDEAAIVPNVILDALDKYDPEQGSFMCYLGQAIRNRTIDGLRRERRNPAARPISLDPDFFQTCNESEYFEDMIDDMARRHELQTYDKLLASFNLSINTLSEIAPRRPSTREQARRAAWVIAQDGEASTYLLNKGMLPHKILEQRFHITRSILERYRKFIIAVVLVYVYDLSYIKPYVTPALMEESPWYEQEAMHA